jgi:dTDP-4-dehydrorhamnose reductase|tara:strand:- start:3572 stop:4450 length:879 start_codon:yes stop_codon:yes gene_type:complete
MKGRKNNILPILGASGYIGNYLSNRFKQEKYKVIGTYCSSKKRGLIHFDLNKMDIEDLKLDPQKIDYIIIAAAAHASIDESKKHWDYSYKTNVIRINKVIDYCFNHSIIPIYLSSDGVFDGEKGNYGEDDKPNPINCYGRMRYEVEKHILESDKPFIILRTGRVFGTDMDDGTLLTNTLNEMKQGKKLFYITDMVFTPVYVSDLFEFIKFMIKKKCEGIFHIASLRPTTRYEIAQTIKKFFDLKTSDINPCKLKSLNSLDKKPKHTELDIGKYKKLTGFEYKPIEYYLNLIH